MRSWIPWTLVLFLLGVCGYLYVRRYDNVLAWKTRAVRCAAIADQQQQLLKHWLSSQKR